MLQLARAKILLRLMRYLQESGRGRGWLSTRWKEVKDHWRVGFMPTSAKPSRLRLTCSPPAAPPREVQRAPRVARRSPGSGV